MRPFMGWSECPNLLPRIRHWWRATNTLLAQKRKFIKNSNKYSEGLWVSGGCSLFIPLLKTPIFMNQLSLWERNKKSNNINMLISIFMDLITMNNKTSLCNHRGSKRKMKIIHKQFIRTKIFDFFNLIYFLAFMIKDDQVFYLVNSQR